MVIYLVDGYNLLFRSIHFAPDKKLKEQRAQLIDELSLRVYLSKFHVIVVFDSHSQFGTSEQRIINQLPVHFTEHGQTADEYILDVVKKAKNPRLITVVTSDQKLSWQARIKGAQTISIELFMKDLQRINRKRLNYPPPSQKKESSQERVKLLSQEEKYEKIFEDKLLQEGYVSPQLKRNLGEEDSGDERVGNEGEGEKFFYESDFDRWLRLFDSDERLD